MGIIKATTPAIEEALANRWLEAVEPDDMGNKTVFVRGMQVRRGEGPNTEGSSDLVPNGSVIHVYPSQLMMLMGGGKVVDYTTEEGYYTIDHSSAPFMFNGQFGEALKESFNRTRFDGITPGAQKVYYINLQEIKGIKFGTRNPINYFDSSYNAELLLRVHGIYSIKVTDPLRFYAEVVPKNADKMEIDFVNEQYPSELLEAFQASVNQMSADDTRISFVTSKSREPGRHMADTLDEERNKLRGVEIQVAGTASITYDEESQNLINLRNKGAMMGDLDIHEGYVQDTIAEGLKNAGGNSVGPLVGFMGMGFGIQTGSSFTGAASNTDMQQMQMNQTGQIQGNGGGQSMGNQGAGIQAMGTPAMGTPTMGIPAAKAQPMGSTALGAHSGPDSWYYTNCGTANTGEFCGECGNSRSAGGWTCNCGTTNMGKFCSECGKPRPQADPAASHIMLTGDNRWEL